MNRTGLGTSIEHLTRAVYESVHKWENEEQLKAENINTDEVKFSLHFQTWGSGSCGFSVPGVASTIEAPTVVVRFADKARVYHAGKLAYEVELTNQKFFKDLKSNKLVGARDYDGEIYERGDI